MSERDYIESSGNVFADLGTPRAEEAVAKAGLAQKIIDTIRARRITQVQAAALLGVDQPKISALSRGRLSGFSIDRLLRFLMLLGHDVEITVKSRSRARARLRVAWTAGKRSGYPCGQGFHAPDIRDQALWNGKALPTCLL